MENIQSCNYDSVDKESLSINGYRRWPFDASRLFYTELEDIRATQEPEYRKKGVFSYQHACGFIYDFAARVYQNTGRCISAVVIQGEEEKEKSNLPSNGNRINLELLKQVADPSLSYPLCGRGFRCENCHSREKCEQLESHVAKTIIGNKVNGYRSPAKKLHLESFVQRIKEVLYSGADKQNEDFDKVQECSPFYAEECSNFGHIYYKYNCPMSIVGGIMMPIVINDVIIAAVIIGQFVWNEDHKAEIISHNADICDLQENLWNKETNDRIIEMLAQTVLDIEKRLKLRLERNAAGLFSEIQNGVHSLLTPIHLEDQINNKQLINSVLDYLKGVLSFDEILFIPFDRREHVLRKDQTIFGKKNKLELRTEILQRVDLEQQQYIVKSKNGAVYLTRIASLQYELHLFDSNGMEYCKMEFILRLGNKKDIVNEEWRPLCDHMETVLRELYMHWALALRQEEHSQYYVTMRQFTHELGQKSHSGNACMMQMHHQIKKLHEQCSSLRNNLSLLSTEASNWLSKLDRTANDMESIFDGIAYLSQLARAKAQGLKFNPRYYDVRNATLNSMAAQYRMDIRGNGMIIKNKESDTEGRRIYGDKDLVHIAIHNLISNAVKYGYPGTCVYYSCYRGKDRDDRWGMFIDVTDYGLLIPEGDKDRIFLDGERLDAATNNSLGFGLYLTREIMERHGGFCEIAESKLISEFSLPNLSEMIQLYTRVPFAIEKSLVELEEELSKAKRSGMYYEAVHRDMKPSKDPDRPMSVRNLFRRGMMPMAKTTMRLFFPDKEE